MELKYKEFVDLSKYSIDKRKRMFPSKCFGTAIYCIAFRNAYGCFTSHLDSVMAYKLALEDLRSNGFKEVFIGCNNLGRM